RRRATDVLPGGLAVREPPLTPSGDEAREWAEAELEKAIYNDAPSLWDRIRDWLLDLWERLLANTSDIGPVLMPVIVLLAIAAIIGLALLIGGPVRRRRLRGRGSVEVLDDDVRSSA